MTKRIIVLSGSFYSEKTALVNRITAYYGFKIFKPLEYIKSKIASEEIKNHKIFQDEESIFYANNSFNWILEGIKSFEKEKENITGIIVDSATTIEQVKFIKDSFWPNVIHIHIAPRREVFRKRYSNAKADVSGTNNIYDDVQENMNENKTKDLEESADLVIETEHCTIQDVFTKAMSFIKVSGSKERGYVDVVVGGQYGSEGKGQICSFLANEYDILVRVGGPNAGHYVIEKNDTYIYHLLPSGTGRNKTSVLVISAGMTINLETIKREIKELGITHQRLLVDPQAMIIADEDIKNEAVLQKDIGSTGQGVGASTARRIMNRGHGVKLARDIEELKPYLKNTAEYLGTALKEDCKILIEGTQGTGLSLYHGVYPYVTSRDTTASSCLSEAGISPKWVRKIILVCRTYPIRVANPEGGSSGPLKQELTWEEVAKRSGNSKEELMKREKTSTTKRDRRVGEFEWDLLHKAAMLNGATDIALTFIDYISKANSEVHRFEQLNEETINFIHEVERVGNAPVSLVSNGFDKYSVIDRRLW